MKGRRPDFRGCEDIPIDVVDVHAISSFGECQDERNPDMAAAADHGEIGVLDAHSRRRCRAQSGEIHACPPSIHVMSVVPPCIGDMWGT